MYAASLKKRSLWRDLGPQISSDTTFRLKESQSGHIDLAVSFGERRILQIILLSATNLEVQLARLDNFLSKDSSASKLVMLVSEDGNSNPVSLLNELQMHLIGQQTPSTAILVPSASEILTYLKTYLGGSHFRTDHIRPTVLQPASAIAVATAAASYRPLTQHEANVVHDMFGSIKGLCEAVNTQEGQDKLASYLDAQTVRNMVLFWKEEYPL